MNKVADNSGPLSMLTKREHFAAAVMPYLLTPGNHDGRYNEADLEYAAETAVRAADALLVALAAPKTTK